MNTILTYLAILFYVIIGIETLYNRHFKRYDYNLTDTCTNIKISFVAGIFDLLTQGLGIALLFYIQKYALFSIHMNGFMWFLLFLGEDLTYYVMHLLEHKIPLLWAIHSVHHSSNYLNYSTAIRNSVFQPLYRYFFFLPLVLLGFDPLAIILVYTLNQTYNFFIHTKHVKNLGFLEWFLNTPSHHCVHHGRNKQYIDKNFGQVLIIWDRLFRTFQPQAEKIDFGITKKINTYSLRTVIFGGWRDAFNVYLDGLTRFNLKLKSKL